MVREDTATAPDRSAQLCVSGARIGAQGPGVSRRLATLSTRQTADTGVHEQKRVAAALGTSMTSAASTLGISPGRLRRRAARLAGRMSWGFADQGASSLSNFLLGLVVASAVDPTTFGAFSIAYATYIIAVGVSRGAVAQPLVVRYSAVDPGSWRDGVARATGCAFVIGLVVGAMCLVLGTAIGGVVGAALQALALIMPGLLVQDTWRFAFFAAARGRAAFVNDAAWLAVQIPALALVVVVGKDVVPAAVLAWGGAGTAAALLGSVQARLAVRPAGTARWLREHRYLLLRYVPEVMASLSSSQLSVFAVGALAGLVTLGQLRAGQLLLGPLLTLLLGIQLVAVPEAVRALTTSVGRLHLLCVGSGLAMASVSVVWGALLAVVPREIGESVLKANWVPAHEVILPLALGLAAGDISLGAMIGLRAYAAATRSLRATSLTSAVSFTAAVGGAVLGGGVGAAWGIVAAHLIGIPIWWREYRRATADYLAFDRAEAAPEQSPAESSIPAVPTEADSGTATK
jgi:hypothetical protein